MKTFFEIKEYVLNKIFAARTKWNLILKTNTTFRRWTRILYIVIIYIVIFIAFDFLLSKQINYYNSNLNEKRVLAQLLGNQEGSLYNERLRIIALVVIEKFFEIIAFASLTSQLVDAMANSNVKILLPEVLVIRRKTSAGDGQNKLFLNVIVGNPKRLDIVNWVCTINVIYQKAKRKTQNEKAKINADTVKHYTVPYIANYNQFIFKVEELPWPFLEHYLTPGKEGEEYAEVDSIHVIITGENPTNGKTVSVHDYYHRNRIIISNKLLNEEFKKDVNKERNTWIPINWKLFKRPAPAPKEYRNNVIDEINEIIIREKNNKGQSRSTIVPDTCPYLKGAPTP